MKIILLCKPKFSSARKTSFLLKTQKTTTLQQDTGGNTTNIVLKRRLELFLKVPPLKKLEFQNQKKEWNLYKKKISIEKLNQWLKSSVPSSIHLHPALCNTLNFMRTKISHIIWQFSKIWAEKFKVVFLTENWRRWYLEDADSYFDISFLNLKF